MTVKVPTEILGLVNSQAETAILHAMRKDLAQAVYLAESLTTEDFYDARLGVVFEAIRLLLLGIEPVDTRAILAQCAVIIRDRKLKLYIDEEFIEGLDQGDPRRAEMYANTVKKLSWLRKAGDFAFWLTQELQGRPKPDQLFAAAQERWQMLAPKDVKSRFVYGWDTEESHEVVVKERVRQFESGVRSQFSWPWASWNRMIRPMYKGAVAIIAAADGMGKSTYLEEIAEHWARQSVHVVYVHLEDDLDYKRDRRLTRYSGVPIEKIQDGNFTEEEWSRIKQARQYISGWMSYLHYLDAAGDNMASILAELDARVAEGVCDAVVIDYIDKAQSSRGQMLAFGSNTWERQANDMEQFKTFIQRHRLVGLTATQGNKAMQGDGVQTRRTIQGSGQKSQKAQLVVILTRELLGPEGFTVPGTNHQMAEEGEYSPIVKVRVDKQNIGRTGNFNQFLNGAQFTVRDLQMERTNLNEEPSQPQFKYDGSGVREPKDDEAPGQSHMKMVK